MERKNITGFFQLGKFRFENEHIEKWVDINLMGKMEYFYELKKTRITPLNPNEALLKFEFELELLPNTAKITFEGDCLFISPKVKIFILILKAKKNSKIRNRNQTFFKALDKLLSRRCLDYAKEIGEKEGVSFHNYEYMLQLLGIDKISFNNQKKKILSLKGDSLVPKKKEVNQITVLKRCEMCEKYVNCKIYDKVCEELAFLKHFIDLKNSNEIAKYCKSYRK